MGPPELPGGNTAPSYYPTVREVSFNGAAGITRRKHEDEDAAYDAAYALQWGRRNYPAETCVPAVIQAPRHLRASMGPPELPGGNVK